MRSGDTYRWAKRTRRAEVNGFKSSRLHHYNTPHPHAQDVVAQLMRGWLMRRRGVLTARPAPAVMMGPSKHGKCLVATHLNIAKLRVYQAARLAKTGVDQRRQHKQAGLTHDWCSARNHWAANICRRIDRMVAAKGPAHVE